MRLRLPPGYLEKGKAKPLARGPPDPRGIIATKAAPVVSHLAKVGFHGGPASAMAGTDWIMVAIAAPFARLCTQAGYLILQRLTDPHFRRWTRPIVMMIGIFHLGRGLTLLLGA